MHVNTFRPSFNEQPALVKSPENPEKPLISTGPSQDILQRKHRDSIAGKSPQFGALVKISGTGAAKQEKNGPLRFSLREAVELARGYKQAPEEYVAGYYSDPKNEYKVWTATGDEKWLLDETRKQSDEAFTRTFERLKRKKGIRNYIMLEPIAISNFLDRFHLDKLRIRF